MTMMTTHHRQPTDQQKDHTRTAVRRDLRKICLAYGPASDQAKSIGYGSGFNGSETRSSSSGMSDSTASRGMRPDWASEWLVDARTTLALIIRLGDGSSARGERQWTGPFVPAALVGTVCAAADGLVDTWPVRIERLWDKVARLASEAGKRWPPTPAKGAVVTVGADKPVKVGDRGNFTEMCVECKSNIGGNADDPVARIDGKPFHRKPCYQTVWQRTKRASK